MKVNKCFVSFQGTGFLSGQKQFFVRLQGCSIPCPIKKICDEPAALSDSKLHQSVELTADEIVMQALESVGVDGWLHITGGEPFEQQHELKILVAVARNARMNVQIQTSGIKQSGIPETDCKLSVSPKCFENDLMIKHGFEMVLVVSEWFTKQAAFDLYQKTNFEHYFLVPADGENGSVQKTIELIEWLHKRNQVGWRLTTQMHKFFGIA